MKKLKFTLTNAWYWVILILVCYLSENISMLYKSGFSHWGFSYLSLTLLSLCIALSLLVYFFFEHKENGMRIDFVLSPILLILFACSCIGIWGNRDVYDIVGKYHHVTVNISTYDKVVSTVETGIIYIFIYIISFCRNRFALRLKRLLPLAYLFILFLVGVIVFSVISEFDAYKQIFIGGEEEYRLFGLFTNSNIFGLAILMGILCLLALNANKRRWWTHILLPIFVFEAFLIRTSTVFFILLFVLPIAFIINLIAIFRKSALKGTLVLLITFSFFLTLTLVSYAMANKEVPFFVFAQKHLLDHILNKDFNTFTNRTLIWKASINFVNDKPFQLFFGFGEFIEKEIVESLTFAENGWMVHSLHNGFLELIYKGGIILLAGYALAIGYFFYVCLRLCFKGRARFALLHMVCLTAMMAHSMMESTHFFGGTISCVIETILFYLPPIIVYKRMKYPQIEESVKYGNFWQNSLSVSSLTKVISFTLLPIALGVGFIYLMVKDYYSPKWSHIIQLAVFELGIAAIFGSYIVSLLYKKSSDKGFKFFLGLTTFFIYIAPIGLGFLIAYLLHYPEEKMFSFVKSFALIGSGAMIITIFALTVLFKGGSLKEWAKYTFGGIIGLGTFPLIMFVISLVIGIGFLNSKGYVEATDVVLITVFASIFYFGTFMFINFESFNRVKKEISDNSLYHLRRDLFNKEVIV